MSRMRNRLEDILGVDLAEAIREDGEDGHGCARELRFDSETVGNEPVGDDSEDDVYVYDEGLGSEDGFTEWDEEEVEEENEMGEGDDGETQGSEFESVHGVENLGSDYESLHGENEVDGEGFTTPKRDRQMVRTVFGDEEEIPPPNLGMVFGSWDELDTYFWSYARQKGFGIVRAASGWVKVKKELGTGKCCKQRRNAKWTCDCYGKASRKRKVDPLKEGLIQDEETVVQRKTKKCGCEVELYASVNAEGNWVVRKVNLEHTGHVVTPGKSKDVSMYRKHDLVTKHKHLVKQVVSAKKSRVKVSQMYGCFGRQVNGVDQLTFTQKDLTNAVAEEEKKRLELTEGDANGMIEYFNKMSADNQNFFHLCRFGKDSSLQDVVWVDARSRDAYEEFGDVVCFDSTYLTNKFHFPFAVFLGVNHHGQSILFGCALISRETAETYEWVMRTWLHCMGGKAPTAILTDQDPAIRKAVHCTMAETTHRWCIWHILQKFGKYVKRDDADDYEALKDDFDSLIYGSLDADEFEARWCDAIEHYELQDNAWLEGLYEERVMWIPAYLKHLFWAGMKTTQRSESFNHFFKGYVDKHTTLSHFVIRYCDAMTVRAEAERMADSNTQRYVRHLVTDFPTEVLFQKCYTDAKFKEVQGQCKKMLYVRPVDQYEISTNLIEFIIEGRVWIKPKNAKKDAVTKIRRCYRVVYDSSTYEVSCDCKHFECHGIICRHMILVYDLNGVTVVPEKYVLRRWRKDVQRKHTRVKVAYHDPLTTDEVRNYHNLMGTYEPICSKASICKEAVQAVKEMLQLMDLRVDEVLAMVAKRQLAGGNENGTGDEEGVHGVVRTPSSVAQNKGPEGTNTPMTVASGIRNNTTPVSGFQGSYEGSAPGRIKDPPLPKKKAHRTTSVRYPSCTEKKGKERAANKAKNDARKKAAQTPTSISLGTSEYIRSVGGIQMRDLDGSLGYFTTVRGGHSGGVFASLLGLTPGTSGSYHN